MINVRRGLAGALSGLWLALASAGCTDVELSSLPDAPPPPIDNFLRISGDFCTTDPLAIEFPVKIMFIVDTSESMAVTDPPNPANNNFTGRTAAVNDVIDALAGTPGVEISIVSFNGATNDETGGFQPVLTPENVAFLKQAAFNLQAVADQTNFQGALEQARNIISDDINNTDELVRARSKYSLIFLSDGFPNPIDPPDNTPESILDLAQDIQDLERERRLVELKMHTVYLAGITPPRFQQEPLNLLREMSEVGLGTFRNVQNGEAINFLDIGFTSFRRRFSLKTFLVRNVNAAPLRDLNPMTDSDGDGLTDDEELLLGTHPAIRDTDGDGFNDLLERRLGKSGFDPLDGADADCQVLPGDDFNRRDDDADGLLNCEERFIGTNQKLFDSDADGLPDLFETRAQLSVVDDDFFGDLDRDGTANGFELRDHTNPRLDDQSDFFTLRYQYDVRQTEVRESQICYDFNVQNIRLSPSVNEAGVQEGWNTIYLIVGEVPGDDVRDFGNFRVACVRARYDAATDSKLPTNGAVTITEDDFVPATGLTSAEVDALLVPEEDCITP